MHQPDSTIPLTVSKSGICVVDGWGISVQVEASHLVIRDGIGSTRREARFARATSGLRRIVLVGHTGHWTLDSIRWLADVGVGLLHVDLDGRVLATSASLGRDDPRLRRAQALAKGNPVGMAIARDLLRQKLSGQQRVAQQLPGGLIAGESIDALIPELDPAQDERELMLVEAAAASVYWSAWAPVPVTWVRRDLPRVPDHWLTFGGRASPLTGNPRLAGNPPNAMLNLAYAIGETEARLACLAMGLDPGLGVLHADQKARDSLACDLLEVIRPEIDDYILGLLQTSVLQRDDVHEMSSGQVRILPPLSHRIVESAPMWSTRLAPVVEWVANAFAESSPSRTLFAPAVLSQANRAVARAGIVRRRRMDAPQPRAVCAGCGIQVVKDNRWCKACRPSEKLAAGKAGLAAGRARRAELHAVGLDPSTSPIAKAKNRAARLRRRAEEVAWDAEHAEQPAKEVFLREVLPAIRNVPVRQLARSTGLSVGQCSYIRRGERVPHPRWWSQLLAIPEQ